MKNNSLSLTLKGTLYPLEVIYGACYVFLDRAYVFLDTDEKDNIIVTLTGKNKMSKRDLEHLIGEFNNELLNYNLRYQISTKNQKLREYILERALVGSLFGKKIKKIQSDNQEETIEELTNDITEHWGDDKLGIAIPWEEKFKAKADSRSTNKKRNNILWK